MKRPRFSFLLSLLLASCSSAPTPGYRDLDADSRLLFLQYYKVLKPEQRDEILQGWTPARSLLKSWKISNPSIEALGRPRLRISSKASNPVRQGQTLELEAHLEYSDGTSADVTQAVHWEVLPSIVTIEKRDGPAVLSYGCVAADVEVSATLLDAVDASFPIEFRKDVKSLDLYLAASSNVFEESEFLELKATATCADGTRSDITCQASWFTDPSTGDFNGCGNLHISSERALREGQLSASVSYAGLTRTRTLRFSARGTQ